MDRNLVLKILGKTNTIILEDGIFNIINILDFLRAKIIKGEDLEKENVPNVQKRLTDIKVLVSPLIDDLDKVVGYTNSKIYLEKYLKDICFNIEELINSIDPLEKKDFILYTNTLMDLALKY